MAPSMRAATHLDPRHTEHLEVFKNLELEDIEGLFIVTKKLITETSEILLVNSIEVTSPSWPRSTMLDDRA